MSTTAKRIYNLQKDTPDPRDYVIQFDVNSGAIEVKNKDKKKRIFPKITRVKKVQIVLFNPVNE